MSLTPKNEQTAQKKAKLLTALKKTLGVVTPACKSCNISRSTHYMWCREDEEYAAAVNEMVFEMDDIFCTTIYEAIIDKNMKVVMELVDSKRFKHLGFGKNTNSITVTDNISEVVINVKGRE